MDNSLRSRNGNIGTPESEKVLRDTYILLASTMLPTVIGAGLGMSLGLVNLFGPGLLGWIIYMVVMFGLIYFINKNKENKFGVVLLYVLTFIMGLMMSRLLSVSLKLPNGGEVIALAFMGTAAIFATCAAASSVFKVDLKLWGKVLTVLLITLIIVMIGVMILQIPAMMVFICAAILLLFSAFLFYDLSSIKQGAETSAVMATLGIYLDLINIFQSLLSLLGIGFGKDE